MKQYWLVLYPHVFLWVKKQKGLVYNSDNYKLIHFHNEGLLTVLVDKLLQIDNLYRVTIDTSFLSNEIVESWVNDLLVAECALLIECNGINNCPVSLKPELKVQDSIDAYRRMHDEKTGLPIMSNLHKLVFHINGSLFGNDDYSEQVIYPRTGTMHLSVNEICSFINSFGDTSFLSEIVLVGCLWEFPNYTSLILFLRELGVVIAVYCTEADFLCYGYSKLESDIIYHICITDSEFEYCQPLADVSRNYNIHIDFIVTSIIEYEYANELIERYQLSDNSRIYPVYTGENQNFLRDNLYLNEQDFEEICLTKREIFANQVINSNFFGVFTVLSNGTVFSGNMQFKIGTIQDDLYSLVYCEIISENSWFYIRNQKPCIDCVYQYLCPSPSTYERVIGEPNLCHIKSSAL